MKIASLIFAIAFACCERAASDVITLPASLLEAEPNGLGYADHYGKLSSWWELGGVRVSPNCVLPIRINFHSAQDKVANSILGWNWWMPVMESTVVKINEQHVVVNTIGGSKLHLWKSVKDTSLYQSPDRKWSARVDQKGNFDIQEETGKCKMSYHKGRLQFIALPEGEQLNWKYDAAGHPLEISNAKAQPLFRLDYDDRGFPSGGEFAGSNGHREKISLHVSNPSEIGLPIIVPALTKLTVPTNKITGFLYEQNGKTGLKLTAQYGSDLKDESFEWDMQSGIISKALEGKYAIEPRGVRPKISLFQPGESAQSYWYDASKGLAFSAYNNRTIERSYISTEGANFGRQRKVITKDGGDVIENANYHYDALGRLLMESSLSKRVTYIYAQPDQIAMQSKPAENETVRYIGENGELLEELIGPYIQVSYVGGVPKWKISQN